MKEIGINVALGVWCSRQNHFQKFVIHYFAHPPLSQLRIFLLNSCSLMFFTVARRKSDLQTNLVKKHYTTDKKIFLRFENILCGRAKCYLFNREILNSPSVLAYCTFGHHRNRPAPEMVESFVRFYKIAGCSLMIGSREKVNVNFFMRPVTLHPLGS